MKNFTKIVVAALMVGSLGFTGCKKGENDPFLSLRSRKARVAGEWTVSAGSGSTVSGSTTVTWTYDGATETTTYPSPIPASTDKYTIDIIINKDGTFEWKVTDTDTNPDPVETTKGEWNFVGGVGEAKNKQSIIMYTSSYSDGTNSVTYTGDDRPTSVMMIDQLKNKEIIVKMDGTNTNGTTTTTTTGTWTWTAK